MEKAIIVKLHKDFEQSVYKEENAGMEFWLARDLQNLLGYTKWENFAKVIEKAKTACKTSGFEPLDHFPDIRKMVDIGLGAKREIEDIALTSSQAVKENPNWICRQEILKNAKVIYAA